MKLSIALLVLSFTASAALKIGTFNIRNFDMKGTQTDKTLLETQLTNLGADLLAVQEIVNTNSFNNFIMKKFHKYNVVLSKCGGAGKQKLGFVYDLNKLELVKSYEELSLSSITGNNCKSLRPGFVGIFKSKESGQTFAAVALHLKAGGGKRNFARRNKQYLLLNKIKKDLSSKGYENIIFMGDLNTTGYNIKDEDYNNFTRFLGTSDLTTVSENVKCSSYWSGRNTNDGIEESSLLDHVLYTKNFMNSVPRNIKVGAHCKKVSCESVNPSSLGSTYKSVSDHCPLSFEIND